MILNFNLKKKIQRFCLVLICLVVLIFQSDIPNLKALTMDNFQSEMVTEELRLKVPADVKAAWLNAEKEIWEPWLSSQDGFLGRQLFWDKEKEEALILVNWKSKKLWKSIPMSEVNVVQQKFDDNVKAALNVVENPFELIYEGELDKQRLILISSLIFKEEIGLDLLRLFGVKIRVSTN